MGDGQPFNEEEREKWRERGEYIEMVRLAELKDSLLSACLSSKRSQTIAYVYMGRILALESWAFMIEL